MAQVSKKTTEYYDEIRELFPNSLTPLFYNTVRAIPYMGKMLL